MATIKERIEYEGITVADEDLLNVQLDDSAEDLIAELPENALHRVKTILSVGADGVNVSPYRVLRVYKTVSGERAVKAVEVPAFQQTTYEGDFEVSEYNPVYYYLGGKLYVLPLGGTAEVVEFPEVAHGDLLIPGWPRGFTRLVALHAAIQLKEKAIRDLKDDLPDLLTEGALPTPPSAPVFNYSDAVAATVGSTTIGSPGAAPTYAGPTLSLSAVPSISDLDLSTDVSDAALTPPAAPSAPSISAEDALAIAPSVTTIGSLPSDPVYLSQALTMTASPSITALDIDDAGGANIQPPTAPGTPSFVSSDAAVTAIAATSIAALPSVPSYDKPTIGVGYTTALTAFDTRMGQDDTELAQQQLLKARGYLEQFNSDLQAELHEYNSEVEVYRAAVQRDIEQARITQERLIATAQHTDSLETQNKAREMETEVARYRQSLERFLAEVNLYQAEVEVELRQYIANTANTLRLFEIERSSEVAKFNADVSNARAALEASVSAYQAGVSKIIRQAEIASQEAALTAQQSTEASLRNKAQKLQADVEDYASTLRLFQSELALFQAKAQAKLEEFQANVQKDIQRSQVVRSGELEEYSLGIRKSLDTFNSSFQNYQAALTKEIEQARITTGQVLLQANLTNDIGKQNEIQKLASQVQQYQMSLGQYEQNLNSYRAEIERHATVFQGSLERFKTKVVTFRAEISDMRRRLGEMFSSYVKNHSSTLSPNIQLYEV